MKVHRYDYRKYFLRGSKLWFAAHCGVRVADSQFTDWSKVTCKRCIARRKKK